jgi:hypothetical protein
VRICQENYDQCMQKLENFGHDPDFREKYGRRLEGCLYDLNQARAYRDECKANLDAIHLRLVELQDVADDVDSEADSDGERVYPTVMPRPSSDDSDGEWSSSDDSYT